MSNLTGRDPLSNPSFRKPGWLESLGQALFGFSRPLLGAQVEVSSACMGKCEYCPQSSQASQWRTRHISPEIFARLWPVFRLCEGVHLQGWGEPLLHPRFMDFAGLAKKAGCHVSTTSCGLIMGEELTAELVNGNLDYIAFSLAGTDEQSNSCRKNVNFTNVCNNIKILGKTIERTRSNLEIGLAYILLANQIGALERLPELMAELGIKTAVISTLDYLAREEDREIAFLPGDEEKLMEAKFTLKRISAIAESMGRKIHYALPGPKSVRHENGCRENIRKTLYIDAEGYVSPCIYLNVPGSDGEEKRRVFGNVQNEDPLAIWNKMDFASFRKALWEGKPAGPCRACPKRLEILETDLAS